MKPLLIACVASAASMSGCATDPDPLVGAWRSSIQFESGAFAEVHDLEFMLAFNAGGTMTESSNYDAAPPVPPAYGTWRKTGPSAYETTYEFFSTAPAEPTAFARGAGWMPAGRGRLTEKIALAADGRSYTSTLNYEAFDARGRPAEGGGTATGHAVRIGP
jgi:hypothetical protein